jgi:hypothetical protein
MGRSEMTLEPLISIHWTRVVANHPRRQAKYANEQAIELGWPGVFGQLSDLFD